MPIPQVSVFLDNRPGSLFEVISQCDKNHIQILALTIADAGEFGLVRLITEAPEKTYRLLADAGFNLAKAKKNTEVSAVFSSDRDSLSKITRILCDNEINIEYAYSSAVHIDGKVALIVGSSNVEAAEKLLASNGITVLTLDELKKDFK